ncbi:hypothetical protein ABBQ32_007597 [Trebouxia sp. C0010 RCD-2024]
MILEHLPHLATKTIVLASASPRRLELLQLVGIKPRVISSTFDETLPKSGFRNGAEYAVATSRGKALEVAERMTHNQEHADLIIGADTVVELDGDILEKPDDASHAASMLSRLSDREHLVHTGTTLVLSANGLQQDLADGFEVHTFAETTAVQFGKLSDQEVAAYISTGEPFGKAGAYGIQGAASVFVKHIRGDYFNIMGLPLHSFATVLSDLISKKRL